jgi:hypothetical protein
VIAMQRFVPVVLVALYSGCLDPAAFQAREETPAEPAPPPVAVAPAGEPPPVVAPTGEGAIPDVEAIIVDKPKALAENPSYRETENKINAMDPLSAVTQSYFALGSRVHLQNFKHNVDIFYAANERWPTYDEFIEMFAQFDVKLKHLKPWQVYAYDQNDGTIVVMEDLAEKKRRYAEAGLEYKE